MIRDIPDEGVRITPVDVLVFLELSINLASSGSVSVCVCEIDPDASTVSIRIGSVGVAGTISVRYSGLSLISPFVVVVPIFSHLLSEIVSGVANNEPVENHPSELDIVAPDERRVGCSPDLTRKRCVGIPTSDSDILPMTHPVAVTTSMRGSGVYAVTMSGIVVVLPSASTALRTILYLPGCVNTPNAISREEIFTVGLADVKSSSNIVLLFVSVVTSLSTVSVAALRSVRISESW